MTKHVAADPALVIFDKLEGHIADLSAKFVEIGEKYGPDVINLGLDVVRLTGAAPIILGLTLLIFTISAWFLSRKFARDGKYDSFKGPDFTLCCAWVMGIGAVIAGMFVPFTLFNFWNWVAVFYPVAYLARKVMGLD